MGKFKILAAASLLALGLAGCASRSGDQSIAAYCANPNRANFDICKVNSDLLSTRSEVARNRTDIEATRQIADGASASAALAQQTAQQALSKASEGFNCTTRTLRRAQVGSCDAGYVLTSCTQSRYTTSSGGPTVVRDIDDKQCRFATRVLEMKVRCCQVGAAGYSTISVPPPPPAPERPRPVS